MQMVRERNRVLIVEDSAADRRLIAEFFSAQKMRCEMVFRHDGVEAMEFLLDASKNDPSALPALILLDLNLPRKDGREVLAEMKQHDVLKRIPIIVFSSSASHEDITTSYSLHANCYLVKPMDIAQFQDVMNRLETFWLETVQLAQVDCA